MIDLPALALLVACSGRTASQPSGPAPRERWSLNGCGATSGANLQSGPG